MATLAKFVLFSSAAWTATDRSQAGLALDQLDTRVQQPPPTVRVLQHKVFAGYSKVILAGCKLNLSKIIGCVW
jgi:hypothetical protein